MMKNKRKQILWSATLIFSLVVTLLLWPRHRIIDLALIDRQLSTQGYSEVQIDQIKSRLKPDQILTLSVMPYHHDAIERLLLPHYVELLQQGYAPSEAKLLSKADNEMLVTIMIHGHIEGILDWLQTKYLVLDRLKRYQAYALVHTDLSNRAVVERVNADRDYAPYTQVVPVDFKASVILVNKYHELPSSYVPKDLVEARGCGNPNLTQQAAEAYALMCEAATKEGLMMNDATSFRSYGFQASLYESYVHFYGQSYADTISARPGFSEHQTGLAVDLNAGDADFGLFVNTKTYAWVKDHCTEFGFILRYPSGKEAVTGYRFESWHYRYVGVEVAQAIQETGLTLDEYALVFP